jgi:lysophospholipase L1-like esterase
MAVRRAGTARRLLFGVVFLWLVGYGVVLARPWFGFEEPRPHHYLVLGDSYTAGVRLPQEDLWHEQLVVMLRKQGIEILDPVMVAVPGWKASHVLAALETAPDLEAFSLVTILIGSNNHFSRQPVSAFGREFSSLLDVAIERCGRRPERVIVLGMPDWTVTPYGARFELQTEMVEGVETYNDQMRRLTEARGAVWVDLLELSRKIGGDPEMFIDDGLHPTRKMGQRWAETTLESASNILGAD